jgi:hypothetical protein
MAKTEELPAEEQSAFADALSNKCRNELIVHFNNWEIIYQPRIIALVGYSCLKRTKHLSLDSLHEIAELLHEFGYIKCPYKWLKS